MGTRALIHFHDGDAASPILATVYCQMDGYPSGLGDDIKRALIGANGQVRRVVNGYGDASNQINGMQNLAALVISRLYGDRARDGCGGVYLKTPGKSDCGEEYVYFLSSPIGAAFNSNIMFRVATDAGHYNSKTQVWQPLLDTIWEGPLSEFNGELLEKGGDA